MRISWLFAGALLLFSASGVTVAHTQSATSQTTVVPAPGAPQTTVGQPTNSGGYKATFTGCLERADQVATANPAAQSTDTDSQSFMLTRAFRGTAETTQPTPTGTSGTSAVEGSSYKLDAAAATLNPHVGHQVEVTGLVMVVAGGSAATPGATTVAALGATPNLKVESIKMLAETCKR